MEEGVPREVGHGLQQRGEGKQGIEGLDIRAGQTVKKSRTVNHRG